MIQLEKDHARNIFQTAWLAYLVRDFHVSPSWLLVGDGDFFAPGWDVPKVTYETKKLQNVCKKE